MRIDDQLERRRQRQRQEPGRRQVVEQRPPDPGRGDRRRRPEDVADHGRDRLRHQLRRGVGRQGVVVVGTEPERRRGAGLGRVRHRIEQVVPELPAEIGVGGERRLVGVRQHDLRRVEVVLFEILLDRTRPDRPRAAHGIDLGRHREQVGGHPGLDQPVREPAVVAGRVRRDRHLHHPPREIVGLAGVAQAVAEHEQRIRLRHDPSLPRFRADSIHARRRSTALKYAADERPTRPPRPPFFSRVGPGSRAAKPRAQARLPLTPARLAPPQSERRLMKQPLHQRLGADSSLHLRRRNPRLRPSAARAPRRHTHDAGAPLPRPDVRRAGAARRARPVPAAPGPRAGRRPPRSAPADARRGGARPPPPRPDRAAPPPRASARRRAPRLPPGPAARSTRPRARPGRPAPAPAAAGRAAPPGSRARPRPARPVRPQRCSSSSALAGRSACSTRSSPGRSMPRAARSVATQTRARPSRIAATARSGCAARARPTARPPEAAPRQPPRQPRHRLAPAAEDQRRRRLVQPEQVDDRRLRVRRPRPAPPAAPAPAPAPARRGRSAAPPAAPAAPASRPPARPSPRRAASAAPAAARRAPRRARPGSPARACRRPRRARRIRRPPATSAPSARWSPSRPGVPTTRSSPAASAARSARRSAPPVRQPIRAPVPAKSQPSSPRTCLASSRVGVTTSARGPAAGATRPSGADQPPRQRQPESHRLARAGAGGDQQIGVRRLDPQHRPLHRRQPSIAASEERARKSLGQLPLTGNHYSSPEFAPHARRTPPRAGAPGGRPARVHERA